jgi:glycerol-3-phosphate dehydrogenase (NAD(P)+)
MQRTVMPVPGSGILGGLGMGRNIQVLLIAKGLGEMVHFGKALGASSQAFVGVAGIGDLVATATSTNSRNNTFRMRLAKGGAVEEIKETMPELAEGPGLHYIIKFAGII